MLLIQFDTVYSLIQHIYVGERLEPIGQSVTLVDRCGTKVHVSFRKQCQIVLLLKQRETRTQLLNTSCLASGATQTTVNSAPNVA